MLRHVVSTPKKTNQRRSSPDCHKLGFLFFVAPGCAGPAEQGLVFSRLVQAQQLPQRPGTKETRCQSYAVRPTIKCKRTMISMLR